MFPETVSEDIPLNDDVVILFALIVVAFNVVVFMVLILALYHLYIEFPRHQYDDLLAGAKSPSLSSINTD